MGILNGLDLEFGQKIIEIVKNDPKAGKTLWSATTMWQGGTKSESTIRGFKVCTDEPLNFLGTDTAPNPVEMVLAALGGCLVVGYSLNAAMLGVELQKIEIVMEGDLDIRGFLGLPTDILPCYSSVRAKVFLKSDADFDQLEAVHKRALGSSPVGLTLSSNVNLEVELATSDLREE